MKTATSSILTVLVLLALGRTARAAEGDPEPAPVPETDHEDAFDDGGPRSVALLVNPAQMATGTFGAEADFALGRLAALSVEGDAAQIGSMSAYEVIVGAPLYPMGVTFHGFTLHPRVAVMHAQAMNASVDLLAAGGTVGWQWTFPVGFTVRAGAGVVVLSALGGNASAMNDVANVRPLLDGSLGWTF